MNLLYFPFLPFLNSAHPVGFFPGQGPHGNLPQPSRPYLGQEPRHVRSSRPLPDRRHHDIEPPRSEAIEIVKAADAEVLQYRRANEEHVEKSQAKNLDTAFRPNWPKQIGRSKLVTASQVCGDLQRQSHASNPA